MNAAIWFDLFSHFSLDPEPREYCPSFSRHRVRLFFFISRQMAFSYLPPMRAPMRGVKQP